MEVNRIKKKWFHILIPKNVLEFWIAFPIWKTVLSVKMLKKNCVGSRETRVGSTSFCWAYTVFWNALTKEYMWYTRHQQFSRKPCIRYHFHLYVINMFTRKLWTFQWTCLSFLTTALLNTFLYFFLILETMVNITWDNSYFNLYLY